MAAVISLKNLTDKQRKVWRMRRIALEMGMSDSGVSKMLQRAHAKAGLPMCRVSVIKTKPRRVRLYLLSEVLSNIDRIDAEARTIQPKN